MKQVNIGFIGAGSFISMNHLPNAAQCDFIRIRAISDLNPDILAAHKERYAPDYVTEDYRKLLEDPQIELVVIGTRQDTHARLIVESLDAGKWVWCEKPMCDTPEEEAAVMAAEKRNPGRLAIGFNRRFAPAVTKTMELLEKLPRPWFINYRMQSNGGYKKRPNDTFYHERPHIIYEGCHLLDLSYFIMGAAPERIFMSGTKGENDIIVLEYADDSRFLLTITSTAGDRFLEKETMEIYTSEGAISMRDFVELRVRGIPGERDHLFAPKQSVYGPLVKRWGYGFWEYLHSEIVRPDQPQNPGMVQIVPAPEELPYAAEVAKICEETKDSHWIERTLVGDKGWFEAFRHFALARLEGTEPRTADGSAGKFASDLGFALLDSKRLGIPLPFKK